MGFWLERAGANYRNMLSGKKRKSMDPAELTAHSSAKKERPAKWFEEEAQKQKIKEKREKKKFFGLGGLLTKMKSSSKLVSDSTSRLPRMDALLPEKSIDSSQSEKENDRSLDGYNTSAASTVEMPDKVKKNKVLTNLIKGTGTVNVSTISCASDDSRCTTDYTGSEDQNNSLSDFSISSDFGRNTNLRSSSRSMPIVSSSEEHEVNVRRSHSSVTSCSSPISHLPSHFGFGRRSKRISKRPIAMESLQEEESHEPVSGTITPVLPVTSVGEDVAQTPSVSESNAPEDVVTPINKVDLSESMFVTPELSTMGSAQLKRCSVSGSTLQRFGGLLKKGFSSGSKAMAPTSTPVTLRLNRRDTLDSSRIRDRRRCSDVTGLHSFQHMGSTASVDTVNRNIAREKERLESFTERVSVTKLSALNAAKTNDYNTIVIDVQSDGRCISSFSEAVIDNLDVANQVREAIQRLSFDKFAKAAVIPVLTDKGEIVLAAGVVQDKSNLPMSTRIGYDSAITKTCQMKDGLKVLVAPAFFPFDTPYNGELAEAMLRTLFRAVTNNADKIESVTLAAMNDEERTLIINKFDSLIEEKSNGTKNPEVTIRREESM